MALAGKLPPLVTELDGDLGGLARAFEEGTAMAEVYSQDMDRILTDGSARAGDHSGRAFNDGARGHFGELFHDVDREFRAIEERSFTFGGRSGGRFGDGFEEEVRRRSPRIGRRAGQGFLAGFADIGESFQRMMIPLLVGAVVLASPAIGALISSAVAIGLGLGFVGLGTIIAVAMLPKIAKSFAALGNPIRAMFRYAITGAFDDALKGVPKIIRAFIPAFGRGLRDIFNAVAPLVRPLALNIGKALTEVLGGIGTVLKQAGPAIQTWISTIPQVARAFTDMLIEITKDPEAMSRFIGDAATFLSAFLVDTGKVINWLTGVYNWIVKINDASGGLVINNPARIFEGLKIGWDQAEAWVKVKWHELGAWFGQKSSEAGAWFSKIPGRITAVLSKIPDMLNDLWHKVLFGIGWLAGRMLLFLINLPNMLTSGAKALWSFFWVTFTTIVTLVAGLAAKAVEAVVDWFKKLPGRTHDGLISFKNAVVGFFRNAPSWLYNAGKDIVRGVINGVKDMASWAIDKIKDFGGSLIDGFKHGIGSRSPSVKFASAAYTIPQGIVQGIMRGAGMVQRAVRDIVPIPGSGGTVSSAMSVRYAAAGAGGSGTVVLDNTIYLDGTAVARGLSAPAQRRANQSGTTGLGTRPRVGFGT